jgi:hypothetical protein
MKFNYIKEKVSILLSIFITRLARLASGAISFYHSFDLFIHYKRLTAIMFYGLFPLFETLRWVSLYYYRSLQIKHFKVESLYKYIDPDFIYAGCIINILVVILMVTVKCGIVATELKNIKALVRAVEIIFIFLDYMIAHIILIYNHDDFYISYFYKVTRLILSKR